jgi:SsrA-binding protein
MLVIENRKARFNYHIEHTYEAGLVLAGSEVKSLRNKQVNINDAYAVHRRGEIILINSHISEYKGANRFNHDPYRDRILLLKKREIKKLIGLVEKDRYTLVPLKIYFNNKGRAKLLLGVAKGKQKADKRQTIKQREWNIQKQRIAKL